MKLLGESLHDFRLILENRDQTLPELVARPIFTSGKLFLRLHVPMLITFPMGIIFCPFTWITGWKGMKYIIIISITVLVAATLFAIVTDKISETAGHRMIDTPKHPLPKNVALYMQLPLYSIGLFYIIHPMVGLLVLLLAAIYCFYTSVDSLSLLWHISRARAMSYYLHAIILFLIPALLFTFFVAAFNSIYYIFLN